jgi:hypothetical protein
LGPEELNGIGSATCDGEGCLGREELLGAGENAWDREGCLEPEGLLGAGRAAGRSGEETAASTGVSTCKPVLLYVRYLLAPDSGPIVAINDGEMVGVLNGGHLANDWTYMTPYEALVRGYWKDY